jgi:hypothetical protein
MREVLNYFSFSCKAGKPDVFLERHCIVLFFSIFMSFAGAKNHVYGSRLTKKHGCQMMSTLNYLNNHFLALRP